MGAYLVPLAIVAGLIFVGWLVPTIVYGLVHGVIGVYNLASGGWFCWDHRIEGRFTLEVEGFKYYNLSRSSCIKDGVDCIRKLQILLDGQDQIPMKNDYFTYSPPFKSYWKFDRFIGDPFESLILTLANEDGMTYSQRFYWNKKIATRDDLFKQVSAEWLRVRYCRPDSNYCLETEGKIKLMVTERTEKYTRHNPCGEDVSWHDGKIYTSKDQILGLAV